MIIVIFGQPGAGKSTLADMLLGFHHLNADKLYNLFIKNDSNEKQKIIRDLNRLSDIAIILHRCGNNIVISAVYCYKESRNYLNNLSNSVKWIFLTYNEDRGKRKIDFELPLNETVLNINTSFLSPQECELRIREYIKH